jgi:hypothetical protein
MRPDPARPDRAADPLRAAGARRASEINAHGRRSKILLGSGLAIVLSSLLFIVGFIYLRPPAEPSRSTGAGNPVTAEETTTTTAEATPTASVTPSATPTSPPSTTRPPGTSSGGASSGGGPVAGPKPATGFPNASTAGVPAGRSLVASGGIEVSRDGTVIDGKDVTGDIDVQADNVVIRNTRVNGSGDWGIIIRSGATNLTIENVTIRPSGSQAVQTGILNQGGMITVRRTDISGISDGITTSQGLIEDSYLHDPRNLNGDHTDMIQSLDGPGSGMSLIIRHNTIINTNSQTSAIALFQDYGVQHDVLIEYNFLAGGGYTLYAGDGDHTPWNIKILNNTFSKRVFRDGGSYGAVAYWSASGSGNVWSGNVWEDGTELRP